jgi:hypothetical protein
VEVGAGSVLRSALLGPEVYVAPGGKVEEECLVRSADPRGLG